MKAEGQARLELPKSVGYCIHDTERGNRVQVGRGDYMARDIRKEHQDGAQSCFTTCVLLCILVPAVRP